MKQDKFLIGILIFIGVLVLAALALFFVRKDTATYRPDNTPEGVVYDFALALQRDDADRAYGYLADQNNKPTRSAFIQSLHNGYLSVDNNALQVGEATISGNDAWVEVTIQYFGSGPFESGWSNQDRATLVRQNGAWKIVSVPYPYWSYDWYQPTPEPVKP